MKAIIINADDLGFSPQVNAAIIQGGSVRQITAASLMVNMPYAEDAVKAVGEHCPFLSLGLHFTLTCGKPSAGTQSLPNLVDAESGLFKLGFVGLWKALSLSKRRKEILEEIRCEFETQLEIMLRWADIYRIRFDHLDSHQHVHVLPGIFELLYGEAKKRNLVLRIPRERFMSSRRFFRRWTHWMPQGFLKRAILNHFLRVVNSKDQKVGYFGILETGKIDLNALKSIVEAVKNNGSDKNIFEINTHPSFGKNPAQASDDLSPSDELFHRSPWRKTEFDTLQHPELIAFFEKNRIRLSGFS